jgi:hypothetical protein
MNKVSIISVAILITIADLNSICYSQIEIVINGNVVIEEINNNENGLGLTAQSHFVSSTQPRSKTTRTTTTTTTTITITTTTTTTTTIIITTTTTTTTTT